MLYHYQIWSSLDPAQYLGNGKYCMCHLPSQNTSDSALLICVVFVFGNTDTGMSIAHSITLQCIFFSLVPQFYLLLFLHKFQIENSPQHVG